MNMDHTMTMPGMSGMTGMSHSAFALPEWALFLLAVGFLAGTCFYLYRVLFAARIKAHYGYYDLENELGHGICVTAMVTMLSPSVLPVAPTVWIWVLGGGAVWFLVRTFTWGRKLAHTRILWDLIHVAMLGFMALMYAGVTSLLVTVLATAFWIYFIGYAALWAYMTRKDGQSTSFLEFGSDLAHIAMGVVMLLMTLFPSMFMPAMMMGM
ncbi:MAG TPA: DUF5134 domain-containing protein [Oculatellaceae cyanobacterium]